MKLEIEGPLSLEREVLLLMPDGERRVCRAIDLTLPPVFQEMPPAS